MEVYTEDIQLEAAMLERGRLVPELAAARAEFVLLLKEREGLRGIWLDGA
jgi:hypothetical protein